MDDRETQLRDVPCVADDALKELEPSEAEKDHGTPQQQPLLLGQFSSPETGDGSVRKRKTWLLTDSEVTRLKYHFFVVEGRGAQWLTSFSYKFSFFFLQAQGDDEEAGTPEEQQEFLRELATFHKENYLDYKPLKFYGQPLNALK